MSPFLRRVSSEPSLLSSVGIFYADTDFVPLVSWRHSIDARTDLCDPSVFTLR